MICDFISGEIILIDKPKGWTSFDVVAKIRNILSKHYKQKVKVGHGGTLDPMATGLLIIATGKKTKTLNSIQGSDKQYIATIKFGATTPSYDAETPENNIFPTAHLNEKLIAQALNSFLGKQKQIPPPYSAKHKGGKRAYQLAREGKEIKLDPIDVEFKEIEILSLNLPSSLKVKLTVSKGTYIRSFAYDLGIKLNTGAYLTELRRTKIGNYSINDAFTIDQFAQNFLTSCFKN